MLQVLLVTIGPNPLTPSGADPMPTPDPTTESPRQGADVSSQHEVEFPGNLPQPLED